MRREARIVEGLLRSAGIPGRNATRFTEARLQGLLFCVLCFSAVTFVDATTYYVNGVRGDDANDGLSDVHPKRTVANAITTASNGDLIVAIPVFYQETQWNLGFKNLTLDPQDEMMVYDTDPWQTDTIGDGISDGWRQYYFGGSLTTNATSCASCDPDGDGRSNLQEFLGGGDPTDTNSPGTRNLFFYDNLGRLAVVIDTNSTDAAFYDYDAVGNITAIRRETVGPVNLINFSPETGGGNTTLTLQGIGFSPLPAGDTVLFGSITAQVVSATANQIKVIVPTNAVSSLISVQTPLGVSTNSRTFGVGISVQVTPASVTVPVLQQQQFTAAVYGTNDQSVAWNVNGWISAGTTSAYGSITTSGLYTAPTNSPAGGVVAVHARSIADPDPQKDGVATVSIGSTIFQSGPIYSPTVSAQPGLPTVLGPIYSPTVSAQPGVPNVLGPIYSPTVSVGSSQ
jgi:hypothetical protein